MSTFVVGFLWNLGHESSVDSGEEKVREDRLVFASWFQRGRVEIVLVELLED